jgi:peptidoglycan/LPS O-acetylase OafA/YrhL
MKEVRALTGLRGVAAFVVFLAHTRETLEVRGFHLDVPVLVQRLCLSGGRQVDIFFVLSGFILTLIYRNWYTQSVTRHHYGQFLQRRFARIYPLHAFMLILVFCFVTAARIAHVDTVNGLGKFDPATLPAHFLLVHAWGFLGPLGGTWNPPSWSISIETLAYLLFPLLIWSTTRFARKHGLLVFAMAALLGFTLNWLTPWGLAGFPGIARGLSEFALGCSAAYLYDSPVATWLRTRTGSLLSVGALVLCFALTPDTSFAIGLVTAPFLLALSGDNAPARILSCRPVYFLGEISYSIYLGHFLFSSLAYRLISVPWMSTGLVPLWLGLAAITAVVVLLATLTYYIIEKPGRNILRGRHA